MVAGLDDLARDAFLVRESSAPDNGLRSQGPSAISRGARNLCAATMTATIPQIRLTNRTFDELEIGESASLTRLVSEEDIKLFAATSIRRISMQPMRRPIFSDTS